MNKKIIALLTFITFSINAVAEDCPFEGVLDNVSHGSSSPETREWLDHGFGVDHPNVPPPYYNEHGFQCGRGIFLNAPATDGDQAYYIKRHFDVNEIHDEVRFRFILATENLLSSFSDGDEIVIYKFQATRPSNTLFEDKILKVRLKKLNVDRDDNVTWQLEMQWYDNDLVENSIQKTTFHTIDEFIEVEYFWKKTVSTDAIFNMIMHTKLQAGLLVTVGIEGKPEIFLSPYAYENHFTTLRGSSYLGYLNANQNPAKKADEIRLLSPYKYNN